MYKASQINMKNKKPLKEEENRADEPLFPYHTIRKSSFEELENENRLYSLSLTPLQRLIYLMELNVNAFGRQSLLVKELDKNIYRK